MAQYAILIYERETPNGVADLPPEVLEAHMRVPEKVEELGGKILNAQATQPTSTAATIRGDAVTSGAFVQSEEALSGFFVVEARDLDHALAIGKLVPIVSGGVEVRPLLSE
ncbi:YciI family protein [Streptosporangium carneum]|uniref:YCII-related domain-containing protein n=1 Tax=Streptosporangium carneum TaxID=47481 RepID=A0A9W6HXN4_9ACTN|nr:YciI family protein [Streptosporangium carneum]GLK08295.1 hypothetical protein GCM10017600_17000 [Streptosporangium carneum]